MSMYNAAKVLNEFEPTDGSSPFVMERKLRGMYLQHEISYHQIALLLFTKPADDFDPIAENAISVGPKFVKKRPVALGSVGFCLRSKGKTPQPQIKARTAIFK